MKKLFTHENRMIVFNLKNVLEGEGIGVRIRNEFAAGAAGDLATFETWPELWLEEESDYGRARAIVDEIMARPAGPGWYCRGCAEFNEASFRICWNCGQGYE